MQDEYAHCFVHAPSVRYVDSLMVEADDAAHAIEPHDALADVTDAARNLRLPEGSHFTALTSSVWPSNRISGCGCPIWHT